MVAPASKKPVKKEPVAATSEDTVGLDTAFEKRIGISAKTLKPLFDTDKPPAPNSKIKKLHDRIHSIIQEGRLSNFKDFKVWYAIDQAYNVAFQQITPTLINTIRGRGLNANDTLEQVKAWGIAESEMFDDVTQVTTSGIEIKKTLNKKTFFNILVPLVKSYVTIRTAKLFNDRNQYPFFQYSSNKFNEVNRARCEIITDLVQNMSHFYGFPAVLRQSILQSLLYSFALVFPMEAWHYEEQLLDDDKEHVVKEGLRYSIPHPSRTFIDLAHRPSTLNTDTGCEYAGHWRIQKYGEIDNNPKYWNKDKISFGTNWFDSRISGTYFSEVFPCTSKLYANDLAWNASDDKSREQMASLYTASEYDRPAFLTDLFIKLKPVEWGLGKYKNPVWFRFVIASDQTVIWAEPLPYAPVLYLGYDTNEQQARNPSFALEVIPWQDQVGNILSQALLSTKQNLAKIVPYDTDAVDKDKIKDLKTQNQDSSGILFFGYSSKQFRASQIDPTKMFLPVVFPQQNVPEIIGMINTVIQIMERLLGMSSQELGASGSHIQTAEEMRVINSSTSTRVDYTGSFVDEFIDAWKKQIYYAAKNFADEDFESHVTGLSDVAMQALEDLGFELGHNYKGKLHVKGKWSLLPYEVIVSTRDGQNRLNQPAIAQVMAQSLQQVAPILVQAGATPEVIALFDRIWQLAGCPKDFRCEMPPPRPPPPPNPLQNLQEKLNFKDLPDAYKVQFLTMLGLKPDPNQSPDAQLAAAAKQIQEGTLAQVAQSVKPLVEEVQTQQKNEQVMQQQINRMEQILSRLAGIPLPPVAAPATPAPA